MSNYLFDYPEVNAALDKIGDVGCPHSVGEDIASNTCLACQFLHALINPYSGDSHSLVIAKESVKDRLVLIPDWYDALCPVCFGIPEAFFALLVSALKITLVAGARLLRRYSNCRAIPPGVPHVSHLADPHPAKEAANQDDLINRLTDMGAQSPYVLYAKNMAAGLGLSPIQGQVPSYRRYKENGNAT